MTTRVRRIRQSDCDQEFSTGDPVFDFDREGNRLDLSFYFRRVKFEDYESYVMVKDGRVVALLCFREQGGTFYWSRTGVKKEQQGKGYGTKLTEYMGEKAKEHKKKKILVKAREKHWDFLQSMGFRKIREYDDPHWGRAAEMELNLRY